tara:strand:+ start:10346 stop:12091 length:1746 start_codon:yes stop_codon:yes gene_type:complete
MAVPYKIYENTTGVGPFSYSSIQFMTGTPVANQVNVYKNDDKLIQGSGPLQGEYWVQETSQSITLATALTTDDTLEIRRETPDDARIVTFQDGARLSASTLNKTLDQLFFLIQEKSFYSTTLEQFPASLININGITNRDTITWEAAQQKFVPGQLNVSLDELNDASYDSGTVSTGEVLTWGGAFWTPQVNISFDSTANTTFSGSCSFSQPLSVAASTANGHAVNRGQLDAIIQQHSDTYTQGLQNRITALEESKMEIIGKGRYWNTAGNFYPKVMPTTGTTFPVFDTSAGQADYENLHNVSLRAAYYEAATCTNAGGNTTYATNAPPYTASVLLGDWVKWDIFSWDFIFEDTLIIDENSRGNVDSSQYHVILSVDGTTDETESVNRGGSLYYTQAIDEDLDWHPSPGAANFQPTHRDFSFNYPFYTNLHVYAGGVTYGSRLQTVTIPDSNQTEEHDVYFPYASFGEGKYFSQHNNHRNYKAQGSNTWQSAYDRKSNMGMITEPMAIGPFVTNKSQTGFTVMYAINRPVVWSVTNTGAAALPTPHFFMYEHGSNQSDNDPSNLRYSGHPLLKDFNFRFTVIQ